MYLSVQRTPKVRRTQSEPKVLVSANRLCAARHAHLLHHALQCLPGATRTSQTAAVNKLMLIRIVTHPHRSSQRQASSTRANEFGPSCVRHSGRELGARILHRVVSTTTTRQSRVSGDHRRQGCIGLRAATQQGSRVAHYSIRRQGRAEQVTR